MTKNSSSYHKPLNAEEKQVIHGDRGEVKKMFK